MDASNQNSTVADPAVDQSDAEAKAEADKLAWVTAALSSITTREQEFEKGWWNDAKAAEKIYTADNKNNELFVPYNILYSNTEVLLPSLYSATPKPDTRPRFRGNDIKPIPAILDRFLTVAADPASPGGDSFDGAMREAVLSSLVPGMGFVRIRYDENRAFPLTYESGNYRSLVWGKATRWAKVPWIAFKHSMRREQMIEQFQIPPEKASDNSNFISSEGEDDKNNCDVWELWNKKDRKVYFLCEQWREKLLRESDDPLGMENFYPTPGLMMMTMRGGKFLPIPLYNYYKEQAEELNRVSVRLNKVISAIKVRGTYNPLLGDDLKKLLAGDDNDNALIASTDAGMLAQSGGYDKHIWLLPIEKLITVAGELYKNREAIKQVIYELTGISDIIRGSSVASETATAQDLKNKWGTVRLRRMQTVVADYARDLFRMSVDCGSSRIPPEKWKEITQMQEIPTQAEKQAAQQRVMQLQQMQAMGIMPPGMQPPGPQAPGQPPQPPTMPPEIQKLQATLSTPSWEELLGRIQNDMNRTFVVNIQTSSTIDLDTAQDKSEVTEFMNAVGQLMPALQGLGALGPSGLEAAKAILIAVCQRFKFGADIAPIVEKITPPSPAAPEQTGPSPQEQQAAAAEAQFKMQELAAKTQVMQAKTQYELAKIDADRQKLQIEVQAAQLRATTERVNMLAPAQSARTSPQGRGAPRKPA